VATPAAAALAPAAQTAERDWAVPRTLSDTSGSIDADLLIAGAAYAAWAVRSAAAPAAKTLVRIADFIRIYPFICNGGDYHR
jgi:hypothetical protein